MSILDNAKQVAKAVEEIHNLELYQRVLNLHSDIIELVEENNRLRTENQDLKKTVQLREKMVFKEPFYFQEGDETPFCPACWESKNTAAHVIFVVTNEELTRWDCPSCKHVYLVKKNRSAIRHALPHPHIPRGGTPWG
jgi:regulator of replication initiation timing